MSEIDPELRDKIVETHTLVKRMDKEHDEHKKIINAKIRESNRQFEKHVKEVEITFKEQRADIDTVKVFRNKVITYASIASGVIVFFVEPIFDFVRKKMGI